MHHLLTCLRHHLLTCLSQTCERFKKVDSSLMSGTENQSLVPVTEITVGDIACLAACFEVMYGGVLR